MGQSSSIAQYGGKFKAQQWTQIRDNSKLHDEQNIEKGKYRVIKKLVTGQQLQQYKLVFNQEDELKQYITCFQWRLKQAHIVNTRFLAKQTITQFCSSKHAVKVYIQCIPTRLSDITDIPFPQNLYVLKACLHGFNQLFRHIGYFKIEEDFICINSKGQIKVWFNSDLSKNYPNAQDVFDSSSALLQHKMVHELIEIIESSTDRQTEPEISFSQFLQSKKYRQEPNFVQAISYLYQYAQHFDVQIPNQFESMLQIMKEEVDANQSQSRIDGLAQIARLNTNSWERKRQNQSHLVSKNSSENYISLPKASHNQNDISQVYIMPNQTSISNKLSQYQGCYPSNYQIFNQVSPSRSNQNSFFTSSQRLNSSQSHMKTSNQFAPYGCFLQKVSFSYSNQRQKKVNPPKQQPMKQIAEQEKMLELVEEAKNEKDKVANPNYYKDEKRNFRIKSLIEQCEQEMEMSKSNHFLNKLESRQYDEPDSKRRSLLSNSKSRSKVTFSKKMMNDMEQVEQNNTIQKESKHESEIYKISVSKSRNSKKNIISVARQDQVYRSQNSPSSLNRQIDENVMYSQINSKNVNKLERIKESPFAQFQGSGNFLTMVESNINFFNPKDPFATGMASRYATKEKSNAGSPYKYGGIQVDLDPQIVRDLQRYNI